MLIHLLMNFSEYATKSLETTHEVKKDTNKIYEDEVDNICSNKILIEKYPHLIPRDLSKFSTGKNLDRNNLDKFDDITTKNEMEEPETTIESCWSDIIDNLPIQAFRCLVTSLH